MVTGTGGIPINAEGDITIDAGTTSAISLDGTASSNLTATAENAVLTVAAVGGGASQKLVLNSAGTGAEGVLIATTGDAGGITVNASGGNAASDDFVVVANNFTVSATGVVTASEFSSTGPTETGEITSDLDLPNALVIGTTRGGIDITAVGNANLDDLDITTVGDATEMRLTSESTEADAIKIHALAGAGGGIDVDATGVLALSLIHI